MSRRTRRARPKCQHVADSKAVLESGQHGEMKLGKRGVYLVAGDCKLKQFKLISWDQILTMAGY
jgi:hypothetical protein